MHLTHCELLARDSAVVAPLREAMEQEIIYARLGAVLFDLPFYTNIVTMMLGYWLELPAENCPFAQKMHRYHPDLFAWHVLCSVHEEGPLTQTQRLAILGGFFSHIALDLEIHPLVNWCARRDVILNGGNESHQHRLTEKYQSLFLHRELTGYDIVGSPRVFTQKTRIVDFSAFFWLNVKAPVVRWTADLLSGFYHESAPSMRQLGGWIRAFRHFGLMIALPIAKENSLRLGNEANRQSYFDNESFSFMDFWQRGYGRSIELINQAYEVFCRADFSLQSRNAFLDRARITDMSYPPEHGLGALPKYQERELELGIVTG